MMPALASYQDVRKERSIAPMVTSDSTTPAPNLRGKAYGIVTRAQLGWAGSQPRPRLFCSET